VAIYRVTMFFAGQQVGWSESCFMLANPTLPAGQAVITQLIAERSAFLTSLASIVDVRVSDDELFRDIQFQPPGLPAQGGVPDPPAGWQSCVMIRQAGGNAPFRYFSNRYLRGIPANITFGNIYRGVANPGFDARLKVYLNSLKNSFSMKVNTGQLDAGIPILAISATGIVGLTAPLVGANGNSTVEIYGISRRISKKRKFSIRVFVDNQNFTLNGWTGGALGAVGVMKLVKPGLQAIASTQIDGISERRVGRPFGQPRGRAAVVR
jgi:hypothetical protein